MPPDSVPWLLWTRLLEISRLCPPAWTKIPPPPCELLVTDKPSMRDGLHQKLLGNGLVALVAEVLHVLGVRSVVPAGKVSAANGSPPLKFTPFDRTVMPAPS